ncbi:MAG: outer membrane beta-barrel protein, partial [Luteibaculum sp.]
LLSAAVVLTSVAVMGQSLVSKKGEPILPQALDYALGFDAVPVFDILKFNSNDKIGAKSPVAPLTFFAKRFDSENAACRFTLMLNANTNKITSLTPELDNGNAVGTDQVEDIERTRNFDLMLGFGREFRRGNTRIQGYWGIEGFAGLSTSRSEFEYGNDRDDLAVKDDYVVESIAGTTFRLAARGFMGAEYFFAPKFSVSLEYGITALLNITGQGEETTFDVTSDGTNNTASREETLDSGSKGTAFGVNTGVGNASGIMGNAARVGIFMHF